MERIGYLQQCMPLSALTIQFVVNYLRSVIMSVNQTDICLIPKVDTPHFVQQFRPISLCNVVYKVVSKVVVNRLKSNMS